MPEPPAGVPEVLQARNAYLAARERRRQARLALGRAIAEARAQDVSQAAIAEKLKLSRESVRRFEVEYRESLGES